MSQTAILHRKGELFEEGNFWKLRWIMDGAASNAIAGQLQTRPVWIGPSTGPEKLTCTEAQEIARENFMALLERVAPEPQSAMTVADFVKRNFAPQYIATKRLSGRTHYQAILKHVISPEEVDRVFRTDAEKPRTKLKAVLAWPYLSNMRLGDVRPEDVQQLLSAAADHGYSTQTVMHIRNVVKAIFDEARREHCFNGDNPADQVRPPEMIRKEPHTLTLAQARDVLATLRYPEKEMALFAIFTNMNVAEICGLQWKYVNLTNEGSIVDGEPIPPRSIAVRKQWDMREGLSVPDASRARNLQIPEALFAMLLRLCDRAAFNAPDDFVLVTRMGVPVNAHSIAKGRLRSVGVKLQIPWLSWQVFRRTHATLAFELGMREIARASADQASTPAVHGFGASHFRLGSHRIPLASPSGSRI